MVFADVGVAATLPAHQLTSVRFTPQRAGRFGFACGMNMVHGTLLVDRARRHLRGGIQRTGAGAGGRGAGRDRAG